MRILNVMIVSLSAFGYITSSAQAADGDHVLVYINNGSIQCESKGLAPAVTAQTLVEHDINVTLSQCGTLSGLAVPAQCGTGNININVHTIDPADLADAEKLGFKPVAALKNGGDKGYEITECQESKTP